MLGIDLLLLGPALLVLAVATAVVRRERAPRHVPVEADVLVDLTFLRDATSADRLAAALRTSSSGSLGARLMAAEAAGPAPARPVVRTRRRQRPLVAAR